MLAFQNLEVYRTSIEFLVFAHRVRTHVPKTQIDVADQLRRAAQAIPQNIAEGAGRSNRVDRSRHFTIARGLAMESAAHLDVMRVQEVIDAADYSHGCVLLERAVDLLTKLITPTP